MKRRAPVLVLLLAGVLTACGSTYMKQFIGQDVRYIAVKDGPPVNVFDLPDGRRAFQYYWGGGRYVLPATTTTQGRVELVGDAAYYSARTVALPAIVLDTPGCLITYFARWDEAADGWIVDGISYPKRLVC